jgi:hypothetical protein
MHIAGIILATLLIVAFLGCVALAVSALVSILTSQQTGWMKIAWVLVIVALPVLGSVLWFAIGRNIPLVRQS